jgi:hypothetical protein
MIDAGIYFDLSTIRQGPGYMTVELEEVHDKDYCNGRADQQFSMDGGMWTKIYPYGIQSYNLFF